MSTKCIWLARLTVLLRVSIKLHFSVAPPPINPRLHAYAARVIAVGLSVCVCVCVCVCVFVQCGSTTHCVNVGTPTVDSRSLCLESLLLVHGLELLSPLVLQLQLVLFVLLSPLTVYLLQNPALLQHTHTHAYQLHVVCIYHRQEHRGSKYTLCNVVAKRAS